MRDLNLSSEGSPSPPYFLFDLIEPGSSAIGHATGLALFSTSLFFFPKVRACDPFLRKYPENKKKLRIHFVDLLRVLSCESFQYPPSKTQKKHQNGSPLKKKEDLAQ
jgi:hypothetical protein